MKIQKSAIFVNKNLKINMRKIKNIVKSGIIVIVQVNIEMLHIAKYSIPKKKFLYLFTMDLTMIIILL